MIQFKLKSIYLHHNHENQLQVKETPTEDLVVLRVGEPKRRSTNYHHFRVPITSTVDIRYETATPNSILRILFLLENRNLTIQHFIWNEDEQQYIDSPLDSDIIQSQAFQHILHSISFSGPNHLSYIVNSSQRLTDILH